MYDNCAIYLKTVQTSAMKNFFESLKEVLNDINLIFDQNGLKIVGQNNSHIVKVFTRLHAENFNEYYCDSFHKLGIHIPHFFKLIKEFSSNDTMILYVLKEDLTYLHFEYVNEMHKSVSKIKYRLLDIHDEEPELEDMEFENEISIGSSYFQNLCNCMEIIGEHLEIIYYKNQLTFSCCGDFAQKDITIQINDSETNSIYRQRFILKYLKSFTKATNLSNKLVLRIANDMPMLLEYKVADLGTLKFIISPLIE